MPITPEDIVPFNEARANAQLSLLSEVAAGLQDISVGKPGVSVEAAKARSQARLDAAIAARKASA